MRLTLLIAAILALSVLSAAPAPLEPQIPQALAGDTATAVGCPEQDDEEGGEEARHVRTSGDTGGGEDEDAPPKFSNSFHRRWFTMDASTDGFEAPELPVSIEAVCDLPKRLTKQGDQLSGADGVAVVSSRTLIMKDGSVLSGDTGTAELDGADTASLKVRLFRPNHWREDEDGNKIPTFRVRRIDITD
jgi:hypothetical protein